jgi:hypothetical protein
MCGGNTFLPFSLFSFFPQFLRHDATTMVEL